MRVLIGLLVITAVILGLLYMQGIFSPDRVGPGTGVRAPESAGDVLAVVVAERTLPVFSESVGTVRSRRSTRVSPRIMATILTIPVAQGDRIEEGALLARLDDREVASRLASAKAALSQAEARLSIAESAYRRYTELFEKSAATKEQLESVTGDYRVAKASVEGAKEAVRAAEIVVGYTEIRAPLSGVVTEKHADPGDLGLPGKPILVLQDPQDLRLEADVREYLVPWLSVGSEVTVVFGAPLDEEIGTVITERAPEADPRTRTFRFKADLPKTTKARPGNFGRLRFVTGERGVLLVPARAVRRIGQLETVEVVEEGRIRVRHVRTGATHGDEVEVLSGLAAGESVVTGRR